MRETRCWKDGLVAFFLCLSMTGCAAQKAWVNPDTESPPKEYRIGCGDVLDVSVWKNVELSQTLVVLPDGTISFPLIGKVAVENKTISMVTDILRKRISPYVPEPDLTVKVASPASMKIYILGKVSRPGVFVIDSQIDVLQALAMAGGLSPFADKEKIKIIRKQGAQSHIIPFNYIGVIEKGWMEQNVILKRGDIIIVP